MLAIHDYSQLFFVTAFLLCFFLRRNFAEQMCGDT